MVSPVRAEGASERLVPYVATYEARRSGLFPLKVRVTRQLIRLEDGRWHLTQTAEGWLYARREESVLTWEGVYPKPLRYTYVRRWLWQTRRVDLIFDRRAHRLVISVNGERWTQPLGQGDLDILSCQLYLRVQLLEGRVPKGCRMSDGGRLKWTPARLAGEDHILWRGRRYAVQEVRLGGASGIGMQVWLAPALAHLPLRAQYRTPEGDEFVMTLNDLELQ